MILNCQRAVRIPIAKLRRFFVEARRELRIPAEAVTICLVSPAEIARWNRAYRGKKRPTDVLSFPALVTDRKTTRKTNRYAGPKSGKRMPRDGAGYLGDIAIAPAVARQNARRFGRTFDDEMCILILHGMLHLMGYDHESDKGQMDRREKKVRRALGLNQP